LPGFAEPYQPFVAISLSLFAPFETLSFASLRDSPFDEYPNYQRNLNSATQNFSDSLGDGKLPCGNPISLNINSIKSISFTPNACADSTARGKSLLTTVLQLFAASLEGLCLANKPAELYNSTHCYIQHSP